MKLFRSSIVLLTLFTVTALWAWGAGDRCLGLWGDGYWYPATITEAGGGYFSVDFDDGDSASLNASQIRRIDWNVGTVLQCNWKGGGVYYPGRISIKRGDSIHVEYDDGDKEDTVIGMCRSK